MKGSCMKARKLKIHVKTNEFSFPIPALPFWTIEGLLKLIIRISPSKIRSSWSSNSSENEFIESILKSIDSADIHHIFKHLKELEPFEIVNIETYDENEEKVEVKIYTI